MRKCAGHAREAILRWRRERTEPGPISPSAIEVMSMPFPVDEAVSDVLAHLPGAREMLPLVRLPEWLAAEPGIRERRWDGAFLLDSLASACLARLA